MVTLKIVNIHEYMLREKDLGLKVLYRDIEINGKKYRALIDSKELSEMEIITEEDAKLATQSIYLIKEALEETLLKI